jgi:predicted amidophosphoribosyltransferase
MFSDLTGFTERKGTGLPPLDLHSMNCKSLDLCLKRSEDLKAKETRREVEKKFSVPNVTPHAATGSPKMTCAKCGSQFSEESRFCPGCGVPFGTSTPENRGR